MATSVINVGDATQCDGNGGFTVDWGIDENKNGVLDAEEVDGTGVVCNGAAGTSGGIGADGLGYLVATSTEATGTANCSGLGGLKIDGGVDLDNDQTLDAGEIATTAYVCNGDTGAAGAAGEAGLVGATSLLNVSSEPAGANCPAGGIKVEAGVDTSADGNLDAGEVSSTSYVCSVASVISTTDLPGTKGASTTLTGSISVTDPVWRRSDSCGSSPLAGNFFYDAHYLTNATASAQAYSINATWSGVAANGFLHVYDYPFDTLLQGSNCLGANDDLAGDTTQSQVNSIMLRPGQTIVVVASTFSAADVVSSYDITVSNTTPSMPAFGDQLTLTGALTEGSRTWYHDLGCYTNSGTPDYKYETHMIVNDSGVDQFLYAYATFSTDGYLYVYIDGFNPNDQGANCEFSRDDGYDTDNSYGMVVVPAGSYAIFVVSTYSSSELMDYDLYLSSSYFGYNFEAVYGGAYGHTMELTPGTDDGSPILWNLSDQRSSDGAYSFRYAIPSAGNYDTGAPISGYLETYPFYVWSETAK
ncbi:MAG: hypothetical protein OEZ59_14225, partial [Deltaproteobacteria bacterium]|nr:hypothetical protein [Deltaproteobacteria bacterium]